MKTKTGDPISAFFLDQVSLAEATEIGWQYATEVIGTIKQSNPNIEDFVLRGYIQSWNQRSGSPFGPAEIELLLKTPAKPRDKKKHKKDASEFATPLFD